MASDLQEHPDGDPVAAPVLPVYAPDGTCLTDYGPDPVVAAGRAPRTREQRQVEAIAACPPGPELDAWLRGLDLTVLSSAVVVEVVAARTRMQAYHHAGMLDAAAELASRQEMRPDWSPLAGAPPTQSSVAGDELSARLGWSRIAATKTVHRAVMLDGMLAATHDALQTGHIDAAKAEVLATELRDLPYQAAHAVEDAVLPDADRCSASQLRQRVEREVRLVDPDGEARRHLRERRTRRVSHPRSRPHGMASMWLVLDAEDAARVDGVLTHAARAAKALGDDRTLDQLRADGLRDLVVGDVPASEGPAFDVTLTDPEPVLPAPRASSEWLRTNTNGAPVRPKPADTTPTATLTPLSAAPAPTPRPAPTPPPPPPPPPPPTPAPPLPSPAPPDPAPTVRAEGTLLTDPAPTSDGSALTEPSAPIAPTETSAATAPPGTTTQTGATAAPASTGATAVPTSTGATSPSGDTVPVPTARNTGPVTAAGAAARGCTRCSCRPGAEVRITVAASTLLGLDDQPADLDGHGPIDAVAARALAAGGVWRRVVTDPVTGQVLDVGRQRYRPPAALDELVRTRDGTCAFPGCTVPACRCDLDHTVEYHPRPGTDRDDPDARDNTLGATGASTVGRTGAPHQTLGRTDADNLGPLCHRHHRLKSDGGFRLRQVAPGLFEWITPTGHRYLTRPGTGQNHDATADPHDAPPPF